MKKLMTAVIVAVLMTVNVAWAKEPPKMKMTTPIPPGVGTPDRLDTKIGTLNLFDGVPDEATAQKVYDNLDFQRGVQAYLNSIQVASLSGMRHAYLEFGPANKTVLLWLEIGKEPMVIQTPPNVLGIIDDAWFNYVTDFGNAGPDKGQSRGTLVPKQLKALWYIR